MVSTISHCKRFVVVLNIEDLISSSILTLALEKLSHVSLLRLLNEVDFKNCLQNTFFLKTICIFEDSVQLVFNILDINHMKPFLIVGWLYK